MKKFILGALLATAAASPAAAQQNMYLVKDNHVIATYGVSDVDYVTFNLGDDVANTPLWINIENVGKNTVTYKVNTASPSTYYAHAFVSKYAVNIYSLSYYDDEFDNLPEGTKKLLLQTYLEAEGAYAAQGNQSFTMVDFEDDGTGNEFYTSRFSVRAGTDYFAIAAPFDPSTQELDVNNFVIEPVSTPAPGQTPLPLVFNFVSAENEVATFDLTGTSTELKYVLTCLLEKSAADFYLQLYGADFILGTWGAPWPVADLMEDARWNVYDSGEYTMLVRGVDANGDIVDVRTNFTYEAANAQAGPEIKIFSKTKGANSVSVNFEVSPNKVSEAYVYLDSENNVDDLQNDGWLLYEIATKSTAIDIADEINATGEYTYTNNNVSEEWKSLLIYVRDLDGNRTVCRINFFPDEDTGWSIENPAEDRNASRSAAKRKSFIKNALPRPLKRAN